MAERVKLNDQLNLWGAVAKRTPDAEMFLEMLSTEMGDVAESMMHHTDDLARAIAIGMSPEPFSTAEQEAARVHNSNTRLSALWLTADNISEKKPEARGAKLIGQVCQLYRWKVWGCEFS